MNREAIYAALFALVSAAPGLVTTSRKLISWEQASMSSLPALYQAQDRERAIQSTGLPTKWLISVDLYIYVGTQGAASPGEMLNPILDAIGARLDYQMPGIAQTLGGLVQYARIEGEVMIHEGLLGDKAVAIVPVSILAV